MSSTADYFNMHRSQKVPDKEINLIKIDMNLINSLSSKDSLNLLGINISKFPPIVQFLLLSSAVFLFYLIYGYCQELIFTFEMLKPFGWFLTMFQFLFYIIFGIIEMVFFTEKWQRKINLRAYFFLAFLTVGTMGFSNSSLGYLNYPTQVIFKCCKLIPVLIGGILIQGKRFTKIDWLACFCMSIGLAFFTLADNEVAPSFSLYGVILISIALCFDAAIGNIQEKLMKSSQASNAEVVLYSYGIGFIYILFGQIISGQIFTAMKVTKENPGVYIYVFLFSLSGYIGVNIVLSLVKTYGALTAVTVTTFRKGLTICLSFLFFTKPFVAQYAWSGCIVLAGIYLNIYNKDQAKWNSIFMRSTKKLLQFIRCDKSQIPTDILNI